MGEIDRLSVPFIETVAPDDIAAQADQLRFSRPADVDTGQSLASRKKFLRATLGPDKGDDTFERIINGNELQPISYLARGAIAARAVARIELRSAFGKLGGYGTGFLIAPGVLLTNNHVLPTPEVASSAFAQFSYEVDLDDKPIGPVAFRTNVKALFFTSVQLDFSVVAIEPKSDDGGTLLADFGCLPLLEGVGKVSEAEWLTIIQHPEGDRKQICVRDNQLLKRLDDVLWYTTDTQPGSSGSPVFNNDWYVVALHHKGIPDTRNGVTQTVDGTDYDSRTMNERRVKWVANEGVRVSRIVQTLKQSLPDHPLLAPLYAATPASARIAEPQIIPQSSIAPPKEFVIVPSESSSSFPIQISFQVFADGRVIPSSGVGRASEAAMIDADEVRRSGKTARFDAPFEDDYSNRKGFQADFLGTGVKSVGLPELSDALAAEAAPLIKPVGANKTVLHYHNYSVVMHATRRFAIYSAANVSFSGRHELPRPHDVWRRDPRMLAKYQIEGWYYASNQFDRGHLTRREDLEFGRTPLIALQSAADTCHFTNSTPQHARFNQNKAIWQGIERYILEESIYNGHVDTQIFTGPVLDEGDPTYKEIQYPLQFWKVVAALDADGKLFATAYIAGQQEVIAQYGIETTAAPFGAYKTFQTSIAEIERLTGLTFRCGTGGKTALREHDPLNKPPARGRGRRRRAALNEGTGPGPSLPPGYYEISDLDDIQLPD